MVDEVSERGDGVNLAPWTGEVHLRLVAPSPGRPYGGRRVVGRLASILPLRCGPADDEAVVRLTIRASRAAPVPKRAWEGDDELRPLDELGLAQAAGLAPRLAAGVEVRRLVSSPALRCVQTLQPLADVVGLPIESWDALGPHAGAAGVRSTLGHPAFDDVVLCTHGEVLRPLLRTLRRRGGRTRRRRPRRAAPAREGVGVADVDRFRRLGQLVRAPRAALISTVGLTAMTSTRAERAYAAVQQELDNERAAVLGRTGRRLEEILASVRRAR